MGRLLTVGDIDTSHPLQARSGGNKPMTIIKFVRRDVRNDILQRRKLMKRYGVNATEQLTEENIILFKKVQEFAGSENAWTDQAVIFMRAGENTFRINSIDDLPLFSSHECNLFYVDPPSDQPAVYRPPERSSYTRKPKQGSTNQRSANPISSQRGNYHNHSSSRQQTNRTQRLNNVHMQAQIANLDINNRTVFPDIERATQKFINRNRYKHSSTYYSNPRRSTKDTFSQNNHNVKSYSSGNRNFYKQPSHFNNQVTQLNWGGGYAGQAYR